MEQYVVLVVDDDQEIRDAIEIYLKNEGVAVLKAGDGQEALDIVNEHPVHLIIMDIMMPKLDGIAATYKIREKKNIPILILSAKSEDVDKILGLHVGADDYVTKPFNPMELVARVKSLLRRYVNLGSYEGLRKAIDLNGLGLDKAAKEVTVHGEPVTPIEYKIVELLMTNAGRCSPLTRYTSACGTSRAIMPKIRLPKSVVDLHQGRLDIETDGDLFKVIVVLKLTL